MKSLTLTSAKYTFAKKVVKNLIPWPDYVNFFVFYKKSPKSPFITRQFNYCPLISIFRSIQSNIKMNKQHGNSIRLRSND